MRCGAVRLFTIHGSSIPSSNPQFQDCYHSTHVMTAPLLALAQLSAARRLLACCIEITSDFVECPAIFTRPEQLGTVRDSWRLIGANPSVFPSAFPKAFLRAFHNNAQRPAPISSPVVPRR